MAITTRPDQRSRATHPDARPPRELGLTPPSRRVRVPELAVGMLVIVLFAIGGLLWHLRSIERTPTLAIAKPVERGEVIGADDLRVVYVASGDPLAAMRPAESSRIVGAVALVDLAPGLVVTDDLVAEAAPIGDDEGIVGLPLEPGQYPAFNLAPGDRVDIVRIGGAGSATAGEDRAAPAIVVRAVEVIAVADLVGGERKLVTLRTSHEDAATIGSLDSASVRLVQVSA